MELKSTGIVRRIDDLGRVIIPKEQRRTLGIKEGDPLELFIYQDCLLFKKYDASLPVVSNIMTLCEQLQEPGVLNNLEEADALAIKAFAKVLKKNLNIIAKNEEDAARG